MMVALINNISGEIIDNNIGNVTFIKTVSGDLQGEDYINLNRFICYLQNLTKCDLTVLLDKPDQFGLVNKNNISVVNLEISY